MNSPIQPVLTMPDIQSSVDTRHVAIQRVGVRGVRHPLSLAREDGAQPTVGQWELTVALPAHEKGTHMSRFLALLETHAHQPLTPVGFCDMGRDMLPLLNAQRGDIEVSFPYFMRKSAPVSGVASLMDYQVSWQVVAQDDGAGQVRTQFAVTLLVPVTSLCPCSKAISEYGAHNQRSHLTVRLSFDDPAGLDTDELIRRIEAQGSCQLWGLLKRTDEKYVTEHAYENPKFVEDLVRDVAVAVAAYPGVVRYHVQAENFESIHNHSAYAVVEGEV